MKTTVEISDALLRAAKKIAAEEETTVRALIEEGLRGALEQRAAASRFRLRDASFGEGGLLPDVREGSWERIRDLIYEGRGA
jgi:hypothetical protein